MFKIGDYVKVTKRIQFKFGKPLEEGTALKVVEYGRDGIYKCKRNDDSPIVYSMLKHQLEPVEPSENMMWYYLERNSKNHNFVVYVDSWGFVRIDEGDIVYDYNLSNSACFRKEDANAITRILAERFGAAHVLKKSGTHMTSECYAQGGIER